MKISKARRRSEDLLQSARLRRTKSRVSVLEVLIDSKRPLTQDEMGEKLGKNRPNKVTIYRILENLLEAGIIHRAFLQDRSWHFEMADKCSDQQCHPHFTCVKCEQTHCLTDAIVPMAKSPKGFVIQHQQVQLRGLCPECK